MMNSLSQVENFTALYFRSAAVVTQLPLMVILAFSTS